MPNRVLFFVPGKWTWMDTEWTSARCWWFIAVFCRARFFVVAVGQVRWESGLVWGEGGSGYEIYFIRHLQNTVRAFFFYRISFCVATNEKREVRNEWKNKKVRFPTKLFFSFAVFCLWISWLQERLQSNELFLISCQSVLRKRMIAVSALSLLNPSFCMCE
jgi:hypothetical protein